MVVTEYVVAPAQWAGEWRDAFVAFMRLREAAAIYDWHGIRSVMA